MQHINAAGIAKILNKYFANNKDPEIRGLFAFLDKENKDNLKIIDDWQVHVVKKGGCDDCRGGGCSPPKQPNCPANDPSFPLNVLTASLCSICGLPIFEKFEPADKESRKIDGKPVHEECFKKRRGEIIEQNSMGFVPNRIKI